MCPLLLVAAGAVLAVTVAGGDIRFSPTVLHFSVFAHSFFPRVRCLAFVQCTREYRPFTSSEYEHSHTRAGRLRALDGTSFRGKETECNVDSLQIVDTWPQKRFDIRTVTAAIEMNDRVSAHGSDREGDWAAERFSIFFSASMCVPMCTLCTHRPYCRTMFSPLPVYSL